jgi:hypothetical protein
MERLLAEEKRIKGEEVKKKDSDEEVDQTG